MKKLLLLLIFLSLANLVEGQSAKGRIVVERINAASLKNSFGEDPVRRVTIYLPPDYDQTTNRYPVIYYLHGFTWNDSLAIASDHFDKVMDKAINSGKIRPVIVVLPNQYTLFRGSFYTNSSLTGNWADFTAKDLVDFIDKKYRSIPNKDSRGITGHSMGGYGAIKLGMLFPDVFSSVYALSPGVLSLFKEIGPNGEAYRRVQKIQSREELLKADNFLPNLVVALGQAYTPNPSKPPFYCDLPFTYQGDSLIVNDKVLEIWNKNSPLYMIDSYADNLRKLKALKLDWGRNEQFALIPLTCEMFSQKVESLGINHYAEEYIGTHSNKLWTDDGRALHDMLPFFNTYLTFQPVNNTKQTLKKTRK